jgi:hypothetical protein
MSYFWISKENDLFYYVKETKRGTNYEISYIWKAIVATRPYNIYNLLSRWWINRTTFHMSVIWKFDKVIFNFFFYISIIFMDKS